MTEAQHGRSMVRPESEIFPLMRIGKVKRRELWGIAARHNFREALPNRAHNIDSARSGLNETISGPKNSLDLRRLVKQRLAALPRIPRTDAVWALEVIFSLPNGHGVDDVEYFRACTQWCSTWCGGTNNIVSSVVHRDEGAPHCHVLILPMVDGHMRGSEMMGRPATLRARQTQFRGEVAAKFGLQGRRTSAEILTQSADGHTPAAANRQKALPRSKPILCRVCGEPMNAFASASGTAAKCLLHAWVRASECVASSVGKSASPRATAAAVGIALDVLTQIEAAAMSKAST